ncbi:MAG: hypothetical protein U1F10_08245 [Burkholderiales bacterium]
MSSLTRFAVGLVAWLAAGVSGAVPVTYTMHTVASGSLAGLPFAHTPLTFRVSADTSGLQLDPTQQYQRNPATGVAIALDGTPIGTAQQPLAVAAHCDANGSQVGLDSMDTVLPALNLAVGGTVDAAACNLRSSAVLSTAKSTLAVPDGIATSAGTLVIDSVDAFAFESLVRYSPSLKLRVLSNPYGTLAVAGATFDGTVITGNGSDVVIDLGPVTSSSALFLQFDNDLVVGPGQSVTVRAGAPGQVVVLRPPNYVVNIVSVQGTLQAMAWSGAPAPSLALDVPVLEVAAQGRIVAPSGLQVSYPVNAGRVNNQGSIDGGARLRMSMTKITGGGVFLGDVIDFWVPSGVNYPVQGRFYLGNGLHLKGSTAGSVEIIPRIFGYGAPTFMNLLVEGDGLLWVPSDWVPATNPGSPSFPNDPAVRPGQVWPAGATEPSYGGGSMIVQATGSLRLKDGGTGDFMFPGSITLKAGGTLDLNGLAVVQGWTTSGRAFQGAFFEAPDIVSGNGPVSVYTNDRNWVNFSTLPHMPVHAFTFTRNSDGTASYRPADATAPHVNTYSTLIDAAARNECWTCLVDYDAVNVSGP